MIDIILTPEKYIAKIKSKLFNYNPIKPRWYNAPIYKYTLMKESEQITVVGHGKEWSNGEIIIYEITNEGWARDTIYSKMGKHNQAMKSPFSSTGFKNVIKESGVLEIKKDKIGVSEWDIKVDVAQGLIMDVNRKDIINY